MTSGKQIFYAVGRRKRAVARVRVFRGSDEMQVNNQPITTYFPGPIARTAYELPFRVTNTLGRLTATIRVTGSGRSGQLGAVVHGLSRGIAAVREEHRRILRAKGLLTRDSREKESRKYGLAGKARKKKQSPKR